MSVNVESELAETPRIWLPRHRAADEGREIAAGSGAPDATVLKLEVAKGGAGSHGRTRSAPRGCRGRWSSADQGVDRGRGFADALQGAGGHPAVGGDGRAAPHSRGTGHDGLAASHLRSIRGHALRAPSRKLQRQPVQRATLPNLPARTRQPGRHVRRPRCIRATSNRSRASVTSTWSARSPSTSSRGAWSAIPSATWYRCWRSCVWRTSPSRARGVAITTP